MSYRIISDSTLTNLANAIRNKTGYASLMTPERMINEIEDIPIAESLFPYDWNIESSFTNPHVVNDVWVRPSDWPNLDLLASEWRRDDAEVVYYTLDNRARDEWISFQIWTVNAGETATIQQGHLEGSTFVADKTDTMVKGTKFCEACTLDRDYVVIKITPNENVHLTAVRFTPVETSISGRSVAINGKHIKVVERVGTLPFAGKELYAHSVGGASAATQWLERDALAAGTDSSVVIKTNSQLISAGHWYQYCYNLASIDLSRCQTSHWQVESLGGMFQECYSLVNILFGPGWDSSNWIVNSLGSMFSSCYSLRSVDLSWMSTANWRVTTLAAMFYSCYSLNRIDLNHFDTSNWAVTTIDQLFYNCYNLKEAKIDQWDTSKWVLGTGNTSRQMFYRCWKLEENPIKNWDVRNLNPTTLVSLFEECHCLKDAELNWDTSSWTRLTNFSGVFNSCYSAKTANLNTLDFSNLTTTSLSISYLFTQCKKIEQANISGIILSSTITTLDLTKAFNGCLALKDIDISNLHIENRSTVNLSEMAGWCPSLRTLKLYNDGITPGSINVNYSIQNVAYSGASGLEKLDVSLFTYTGTAALNFNLIYRTLQEYYPHYLTSSCGNYDMRYMLNLSNASILRVLNMLPTVSSTKNLYLEQTCKIPLTAADIAIATQKGWTIA